MQDQWNEGDMTEAGDPIIRGAERDVPWEAPQGHAENIEIIESFLSPIFGMPSNVFHEIISDRVHLDVLVYPPTETRDDYVFVTSGMSDLPMSLPEGLPENEHARAELMLALPRAWGDQIAKIIATTDAADPDNAFWPVRVMKWLARYPHLSGTFLGAGHTIQPSEEPFDQSARYTGLMLAHSTLIPNDVALPVLPTGETLNFYGVVFLYPEEMDLKLKKGAQVLFDRLSAQGNLEKLTLSRRSAVRKNPILRLLIGD